MFNLISVVVAIVSAVAPAVPNNYHAVNIVQAKTNSLAYSVLEVEEIPHPPEKSLMSAENVAEDEEGGKSSPSEATERRNEEILAIKDLIRRYFPKEPLMSKIVECESQSRHFFNGKILRGDIVKEDIGLFQINETYWLKKSLELGFDIYDLEGNVKMAKYLYEHGGLNHWSASASCWLKAGDSAN